MPVSDSKLGFQVGQGQGNLEQFQFVPRFAKTLGSIDAARHFTSLGCKTIFRHVELDQKQWWLRGTAGGQMYLDFVVNRYGLRPQDAVYIEGLNEEVSTGMSESDLVLIGQFSVAHAAACKRAGFIGIEFNIAWGNVEDREARILAPYFQQLWAMGAVTGYHSYFLARGPVADWRERAGRYQTITTMLRAHGVTAPAVWALTEAGFEEADIPITNGPLWTLIQKGKITVELAIVHHQTMYELVEHDQTVLCITPFIAWDRSPDFAPYDIAVKPNGQRFDVFMDWHGRYLAMPGRPINNPVPEQPAPVPGSGRATVTSTLGLRVRPEPNSPVVIGTLPFNSVVDVISSENGWSKMEIRVGGVVLIAGASDQNPYGFVASEWLRFG